MHGYKFPGWLKEPLEWQEEDTDETFRARLGFCTHPAFTLGHDEGYGFCVRVFDPQSPLSGGNRYLAEVQIGEAREYALCEDVRALMQFCALWAPVVQAQVDSKRRADEVDESTKAGRAKG